MAIAENGKPITENGEPITRQTRRGSWSRRDGDGDIERRWMVDHGSPPPRRGDGHGATVHAEDPRSTSTETGAGPQPPRDRADARHGRGYGQRVRGPCARSWPRLGGRGGAR